MKNLHNVITEDDFWGELEAIKQRASNLGFNEIVNWIQNKIGKNIWVLKCVCSATSKMSKDDWRDTNHSTNLAEAAHALSQREGVRMSLVGAVKMGRMIDASFLERRTIAENTGVMSRSGNQTITGRTVRNLKRAQKAYAKKKKNETQESEEESGTEMVQARREKSSKPPQKAAAKKKGKTKELKVPSAEILEQVNKLLDGGIPAETANKILQSDKPPSLETLEQANKLLDRNIPVETVNKILEDQM